MPVEVKTDYQIFSRYLPAATEEHSPGTPELYYTGDAEDLAVLVVDKGVSTIYLSKVANPPYTYQNGISSKVMAWAEGKDPLQPQAIIMERTKGEPLFDLMTFEVIDYEAFSYIPAKGMTSMLVLFTNTSYVFVPRKVYSYSGRCAAMFMAEETKDLIKPPQRTVGGDVLCADIMSEFYFIDKVSGRFVDPAINPTRELSRYSADQLSSLIKVKEKAEEKKALPPPSNQVRGGEIPMEALEVKEDTTLIKLSWIMNAKNIPYTANNVWVSRDIPLPVFETDIEFMSIHLGILVVQTVPGKSVSAVGIGAALKIPYNKISLVHIEKSEVKK